MTPPAESATEREPVLEFRNVTKTYQIQRRETPRLGAWAVNKLFEHMRREPFNALDDVSFTVGRGEMVGFLGTNGAGKSTVLKLTAGITQPTSGTVRVRGRVAALLELGVGFHPELTGMENIFYNGSIMGLSRAEILDRLEAIIEFSGLRRFLYEPVKHYSSGMYARLACSVALHVDPDMILVDEILSVGDAEFQGRGMRRIVDAHDRGVTVLLVTHVMPTARYLCDRLIWIEDGKKRLEGPPAEAMPVYLRHIHALALPHTHFLSGHCLVSDSAGPRIVRAGMENADGEAIGEVETGGAVRFVFEIDATRATAPFRLALALRWHDGRVLFEDSTGPLEPGRTSPVVYEVARWPLLRSPRMVLGAALLSADGTVLHDRNAELLQFRTTTDPIIHLDDVVMAPDAKWAVTPLA